jgi:hypothetical protein
MRDIIQSPGKATGFLLFIVCWLFCITYEASAGTVLIHDQQLTIHAKNTPLREILQSVSQQANLLIVYHGATDKSVNVDLNSVPLEEGLKKVLSGSNFSFFYKKSHSAGSEGDIILSKITIIAEGSAVEPVRFGIEPETQAPQAPVIPVAAPIKPAVQSAQEKTGPSHSNEDTPFSDADRDQFIQLTREEMMSQIDGSETDIIPGMAGIPGNSKDLPAKTKGFQVTGVKYNSFFAKIGLKSGDTIHSVNGRPVSSSREFVDAVKDQLEGPGSGTPTRIELDPGVKQGSTKLDAIYVGLK